jgi:hypothetical protein
MPADYTSPERPLWLFSPTVDFWLASGGASVGLLAAIGLIFLHRDMELDALDLVLSEFHLGATYYVILQRRLWRRLPADVLLAPALILALTYALSMSGQTMLLTSVAMYAGIWHRGRQSFGIARFYQRAAGGPTSPAHDYLFQGAIYLPMFASMLAYTHLAPLEYEGEPYFSLDLGGEMTSFAAMVAAAWLAVYFTWTLRRSRSARLFCAQRGRSALHPGEWWVVLAHAVAFGSSYVFGAAKASFLLVIAVHHEVQYLYFAYAVSRRSAAFRETRNRESALCRKGNNPRFEIKHVAIFFIWPVIGFLGAVGGGWFALESLSPLGIGGLFCHYWLDGRIWTRRSLTA